MANFQRAIEQFELDTHASEAFWRGMRGAVKEAISAMSQVLAYKERSYEPLHPQLLPYYYFLAELHRQEGSAPASIPLYRESVSICEKNYGPESACAAELLGALGTALAHDGNFAEAEATLHRSLSLCDRNFGPGSSARGSMLNGLAIVLLYTGRYGEAEAVLREALDINRRRPNPENGEVGATRSKRRVSDPRRLDDHGWPSRGGSADTRDGQGAGIFRIHPAIIAIGCAKDGRYPQLEREATR